MYTPEFARDPHGAYREMRRYNEDFVPVELAPGVRATLVIGWSWAVRILHDPEEFLADPSRWQDSISASCPVRPMMESRDNALRSDGLLHAFFRQVTTRALKVVDLHQMHTVVAKHAETLIDAIARDGAMDLVAGFAGPLAFQTVNTMMGCPPDIGARLARGFAMMFDAEADARQTDAIMDGALDALIDLKRSHPGPDIPTELLRHAGDMDAKTLREQVLTMYAAGTEPLQHLVVNTVLLIMTDQRFRGEVISGACTTGEALQEVLFRDSPLANLCIRYPRQTIPLDGLIAPAGQPEYVQGIVLPAHEPVVISMAACNTDPRILRDADSSGYVDFSRSNAHLSFSTGPHACPARDLTLQIATDAVDRLLDRLPELRLGCRIEDLLWRPGPFHRALEQLPVVWPVRRPSPREEYTARPLIKSLRTGAPT